MDRLHEPSIEFDASYTDDDVFVVVCEGWDYLPNHGGYIFVPVGHRTDLSSIPRLVRPILSKLSLGERAPRVHDLLYHERGHAIMRFDSDLTRNVDVVFSRGESDAILRDLALEDGRRRWKCWAAYFGCRVGGWTRW